MAADSPPIMRDALSPLGRKRGFQPDLSVDSLNSIHMDAKRARLNNLVNSVDRREAFMDMPKKAAACGPKIRFDTLSQDRSTGERSLLLFALVSKSRGLRCSKSHEIGEIEKAAAGATNMSKTTKAPNGETPEVYKPDYPSPRLAQDDSTGIPRCPRCYRSFDSRRALRQHVQRSSCHAMAFPCTTAGCPCGGRAFASQNDLQRHIAANAQISTAEFPNGPPTPQQSNRPASTRRVALAGAVGASLARQRQLAKSAMPASSKDSHNDNATTPVLDIQSQLPVHNYQADVGRMPPIANMHTNMIARQRAFNMLQAQNNGQTPHGILDIGNPHHHNLDQVRKSQRSEAFNGFVRSIEPITPRRKELVNEQMKRDRMTLQQTKVEQEVKIMNTLTHQTQPLTLQQQEQIQHKQRLMAEQQQMMNQQLMMVQRAQAQMKATNTPVRQPQSLTPQQQRILNQQRLEAQQKQRQRMMAEHQQQMLRQQQEMINHQRMNAQQPAARQSQATLPQGQTPRYHGQETAEVAAYQAAVQAQSAPPSNLRSDVAWQAYAQSRRRLDEPKPTFEEYLGQQQRQQVKDLPRSRQDTPSIVTVDEDDVDFDRREYNDDANVRGSTPTIEENKAVLSRPSRRALAYMASKINMRSRPKPKPRSEVKPKPVDVSFWM